MVIGTAAAATPLAKGAEKGMESVMARWNQSKIFTMQVADAMPAASYDYKVTPEMRSFGEVMVHIGQAHLFYVSRLSKTAVPDDLKAPKVAEKEAAKKYL